MKTFFITLVILVSQSTFAQDTFVVQGSLHSIGSDPLRTIKGEVVESGVAISVEQREHIRNHGVMVEPQFDTSDFDSICPDAKFTINTFNLPEISDGMVLEGVMPYQLKVSDVTCRESNAPLFDFFTFQRIIKEGASGNPQGEYNDLIQEYHDNMPGFTKPSAMDELLRLHGETQAEQ